MFNVVKILKFLSATLRSEYDTCNVLWKPFSSTVALIFHLIHFKLLTGVDCSDE